jgi:hypothetical protein
MNIARLTLCLFLAAAAVPAAEGDPFNGRWRLNVERSTGSQPKSEMLTFQVADNEERYFADIVRANGTAMKEEYRARYDGKEYDVKNALTGETTGTTMLVRVDRRSEVRINKRDGRLQSIMLRVVSEDGKTMTSTITGAEGKPFIVRVFEKQ